MVTLTGTFTRLDGDPAAGTVKITPSRSPILDSAGRVVISGPQTFGLDTDGKIAVMLPATDDPSLGEPFSYTIRANFAHTEWTLRNVTLPSSEFEVDLSGAVAIAMAPPADFPELTVLPRPTIVKRGVTITPSLDVEPLRPPAGVTYYTSPTASTSSDGLTPETPLRLATILSEKADAGTIVFADGIYFRNNSPAGGGSATATKSINWLAADGARPILTSFERHSVLTWTLVEGHIYSTSRSATHTVMDTRTLTEWGDYTEYERKGSLSELTGPGQWATTSSTVYVWPLDDTDLTTDYEHIMLAVAQNDLGIIAGAGTTQYVQGLTVMGNHLNNGGISATDGGLTIAVDCAVKHSLQNGFWTTHGGHLIAIDCVATSNGADGFNYHDTAGAGGEFVEIGCVSHHNGFYADVTNSNATSAHEAVRGIRVGGTYYATNGPIVADVNQAQTWNVNCSAGATLNSGSAAWIADATGYDTDPATIWVEDSSAHDGTVGLVGSNGGSVRYRGMRFANLDSTMAGNVTPL